MIPIKSILTIAQIKGAKRAKARKAQKAQASGQARQGPPAASGPSPTTAIIHTAPVSRRDARRARRGR